MKSEAARRVLNMTIQLLTLFLETFEGTWATLDSRGLFHLIWRN